MAANVAATHSVVPLTYTVAEAAVVIGISKPSVYRLLQRRLLRAVPGLRHKLIARRQVHEFANGGPRYD